MDEAKMVFEISVNTSGSTADFHPVAEAKSPEGAGEVVRAICGNPHPGSFVIKVEMRRVL